AAKNACGPKAKLKTPVVRYVTTRPTARSAYTLPKLIPRRTAATKSLPSARAAIVKPTASTTRTTSAAESRPAPPGSRIRSAAIVSGRSGSEVLVGRGLRQLRSGQLLAAAQARPRLVALAERHRELTVLDLHARVAVVLVVVLGVALRLVVLA